MYPNREPSNWKRIVLRLSILAFTMAALAPPAFAEQPDSARELAAEIVVPSITQDSDGSIPASLVLINRSHRVIRVCTLCTAMGSRAKGTFSVALDSELWKSSAPGLEQLSKSVKALAPGDRASIPFTIPMRAPFAYPLRDEPTIELSASYRVSEGFAKKLNLWQGEVSAKKLTLRRPR